MGLHGSARDPNSVPVGAGSLPPEPLSLVTSAFDTSLVACTAEIGLGNERAQADFTHGKQRDLELTS